MNRKQRWKRKRNLLCLFCGEEFNMPGLEVKRYKLRGYKTPSLCPSCRIRRRQEEKKLLRRIERYAA